MGDGVDDGEFDPTTRVRGVEYWTQVASTLPSDQARGLLAANPAIVEEFTSGLPGDLWQTLDSEDALWHDTVFGAGLTGQGKYRPPAMNAMGDYLWSAIFFGGIITSPTEGSTRSVEDSAAGRLALRCLIAAIMLDDDGKLSGFHEVMDDFRNYPGQPRLEESLVPTDPPTDSPPANVAPADDVQQLLASDPMLVQTLRAMDPADLRQALQTSLDESAQPAPTPGGETPTVPGVTGYPFTTFRAPPRDMWDSWDEYYRDLAARTKVRQWQRLAAVVLDEQTKFGFTDYTTVGPGDESDMGQPGIVHERKITRRMGAVLVGAGVVVAAGATAIIVASNSGKSHTAASVSPSVFAIASAATVPSTTPSVTAFTEAVGGPTTPTPTIAAAPAPAAAAVPAPAAVRITDDEDKFIGNPCGTGPLHLHWVIAGGRAGEQVVVDFSGPKLPPMRTFTMASDGSFGVDLAIGGNGNYITKVVTIGGQPAPASNSQNEASVTGCPAP